MALGERLASAVHKLLLRAPPAALALGLLCLVLPAALFSLPLACRPYRIQELSLLAGAAPPRQVQLAAFLPVTLAEDQRGGQPETELGQPPNAQQLKRQATAPASSDRANAAARPQGPNSAHWPLLHATATAWHSAGSHRPQHEIVASARQEWLLARFPPCAVVATLRDGVVVRLPAGIDAGAEAVLLHVPAADASDAYGVALALALIRARAVAPRGKDLVVLFQADGSVGLEAFAAAWRQGDVRSTGGAGGTALHAAVSLRLPATLALPAAPTRLGLALRGPYARQPNLDLAMAAHAAALQHRVALAVADQPQLDNGASVGHILAKELWNQAVDNGTGSHGPLLLHGFQAISLSTVHSSDAKHNKLSEGALFSVMEELLHYLDSLDCHFNLAYTLYVPVGTSLVLTVGSSAPAALTVVASALLPAAALWVQSQPSSPLPAVLWFAWRGLLPAAVTVVAAHTLRAALSDVAAGVTLLLCDCALFVWTLGGRPSQRSPMSRAGLAIALFWLGAGVLTLLPLNTGLVLLLAVWLVLPAAGITHALPRLAMVCTSPLWAAVVIAVVRSESILAAAGGILAPFAGDGDGGRHLPYVAFALALPVHFALVWR